MAFRLDKGSLAPPRRLDDGRMIVDARLTRTGVFIYRNPDGTERREYRAPSEVFKVDSTKTFELVPVTMGHPPEMVNADNAHKYTVGQVGENIRQDGIHLVATLALNTATAIKLVENGMREVSCGYACDLDETPGVSPDGERYDARQYNIRGNHLAIVDAGRAGTAAIKFDAAEQIDSTVGIPSTEKILTDTKESHVDELKKALAEVTEQTKRADAAEKLATENAKRADTADAKIKEIEAQLVKAESDKAVEAKRADEASKRADTAEKSRKDADDAFASKVASRVELEGAAVAVLGRNDKGEVLKADGKATCELAKMTERDIRCEVVTKLEGTVIDAKRSDDAVTMAFDLAIDRAKKSGEALGTARQVISFNRGDAAPAAGDAEAQAKARMQARLNTAATAKETK